MIFIKLLPLLLVTIGISTLAIILLNAGGWASLASMFLLLIPLVISFVVFLALYFNVVLRARAEGIDAS
ncbi:hypothetical protein COU15_01515 [Candidatus Kaiserbacteria bacterium CG10_big_fil_rev_8_21_14_0_10_45_20]|uniref:Uncharacterized protein n=1 Tax=Candidatus Kaiserbacteria bacterium CG10_big_fil_rev_8_21_14_0_10_45_20 TaxID=1974607 RepID=A0A2H0UFW0_9BACT|nr:MAG: hypothetical protein COU15_01515 [Candidatus Kaiserbacteria bacterium CG10_big_fil_rev_8_21_14_0_10_45_20]